MSIFKETMIKAVNSYRVVLRRDLSQSERMLKLKMLNLRSQEVFKSDVALYHVGQGIVADIRPNMLKNIYLIITLKKVALCIVRSWHRARFWILFNWRASHVKS